MSSDIPQLADHAMAVGLDIPRTQQHIEQDIDQNLLGMACVELLARLENEFARAKCQRPADYVDESAETARKMLDLMDMFCGQFLDGKGTDLASKEISKAIMGSHAYDAVLKTRPIGNALLRTFWKAEEIDTIKEAHIKLGESLVRATTATLYQAIMLLDFNSEMGSEIDQSTMVFVTELGQSW